MKNLQNHIFPEVLKELSAACPRITPNQTFPLGIFGSPQCLTDQVSKISTPLYACEESPRLFLGQFCFNGMHGMGYGPEPIFRNQFTRIHTNPVSPVFYSSQGILKINDEFLLPCRKLAQVLPFQSIRPVLQELGSRCRIVCTAIVSLAQGFL